MSPSITTKPPKTRKKAGFTVSDSDIDSILSVGKSKYPYVLAELFPRKPKPNARYYIKFAAWNESTNQLEEKILWVPAKFKTDREKRTYAANQIVKINTALLAGKCFKAKQEPDPAPIIPNVLLLVCIDEMLQIKKKEVRGASGDSYQTAYNKFKAFITAKSLNTNIRDFVSNNAYQYRDYLIVELGNTNRTANNNIIWICALFGMAVDRGYIEKNPFEKMPPLPETDSESNTAFSVEHQDRLETWMKLNDPVLFAFTRFIYSAFIRPKEIRFLRGRDIKNNSITVRGAIAKNKKTQTVPINKKLSDLIGDITQYNQDTYIFGRLLTWFGGGQCSENYAYNRHKKALEATGLTDYNYTLYSWKHTGACRAIEAGVNPRKLQGLLRHSSLEETDTYLRSLGISLQNEELKEVW